MIKCPEVKSPEDTVGSLRLSLPGASIRESVTTVAMYDKAGALLAEPSPPELWMQGRTGVHHQVCSDPELRLADVLVDDIADAELLLLLCPHQLHTLVDENVLLLCLYH